MNLFVSCDHLILIALQTCQKMSLSHTQIIITWNKLTHHVTHLKKPCGLMVVSLEMVKHLSVLLSYEKSSIRMPISELKNLESFKFSFGFW